MPYHARLAAVFVATVLAGSAVLSGQVAFEVASVRANKSGPGGTFMRRLPGVGFEAGNVTARDLILFAFNIQRYRIVGLPGWAESDRFDISARVGTNPPAAQPGTTPEWLMLQT